MGPSDPRYFPLHTAVGAPRGDDPISHLRAQIELQPEGTTTQVFSGFRGTGKSSELLRMKAELEAAGYTVLLVEAAAVVNMFKPLEIGDLLLSVAARVAEEVRERTHQDVARASFFQRLGNFLTTTHVNFNAIETGLDVMKFGAELSRDPLFKERVQAALRGRTADFVSGFVSFMEDARAALGLDGLAKSPVLIVDDLEKIRGSGPDQGAVQRSIEEVFAQFSWALRVVGWHTVWTVPPYLQFLNPTLIKLYDGSAVLPMVRLWRNDEARSPDADGIAALHGFLRKRDADLRSLFEDPASIDLLVTASSGHLRDLVGLFRTLATRAFARPTGVVLTHEVQQELDDYVQSYHRAVFDDDLPWLRAVAQRREIVLPAEAALARASKLIDTHIVMAYRNGRQWCDVNYAVRSKLG